MSASRCPEPERLALDLDDGQEWALTHLEHCEGCADILEEHRLLERELFRAMDPAPPADFVSRVMVRVEQAPAPPRTELLVGGMIFLSSMVALAALVLTSVPSLGALSLDTLDRALARGRWVEGVAAGFSTVWSVAGPTLLIASILTLLFASLGLRKLAATPAPGRVEA
ncbi:MAG TPA: hypothetical protein VK013_13625 [Myxococcaceae bacterium]|nr:hypothetical protein [Myxococcaceae bacterium]